MRIAGKFIIYGFIYYGGSYANMNNNNNINKTISQKKNYGW